MIKLVDTDKKFFDSPDAGTDDCICSRCELPIAEEELVIRIADINEECCEYRFCEMCTERAGVVFIDEVPFYPDPDERKCRICGCTEHNACVNGELGPCWWVAYDLCSHCEIKANGCKKS